MLGTISRHSKADLLTSDDKYRIKPSRYSISIHDIEFGGNFKYQGVVNININVQKDSWKDIVLNAHQLKVHSASLSAGGVKEAKEITYDEKRQRVTLDFGEEIQYSGEAILNLKFEGTINNVRDCPNEGGTRY